MLIQFCTHSRPTVCHFLHQIINTKLRRNYATVVEVEADLQRELERVKVSIMYINPNLWYY